MLGKADAIARPMAEGSAPMSGTPEQVRRFLAAEHARWGAIVRDANVKVD